MDLKELMKRRAERLLFTPHEPLTFHLTCPCCGKLVKISLVNLLVDFFTEKEKQKTQ